VLRIRCEMENIMAQTNRFNFTIPAIESLKLPDRHENGTHRQLLFYDADGNQSVNGLALGLSSGGTKTFMVSRRINGRATKIKLGRYPDMKIPQARIKAKKTLAEIATGINPNEQKHKDRVKKITLRELLELYLSEKDLKERTKQDYEKAIKETFSDYLDQPLDRLTRSVVEKSYKSRMKRSKARAANSIRVLRALFNRAASLYREEGLFQENPVRAITEPGGVGLYKPPRKKTFIDRPDLPIWWKTVEGLNEEAEKYFKFLLLTGVRASEANNILWEDLNFRSKTYHIRDPKNREEDVIIPLSDYLANLLKTNKQSKGRVFPHGASSDYWRDQIIQRSGVSFSRHDLRRTFLTIGESLDIGMLTLKRLANHKTQEHDVTSGYIIATEDRLRVAANSITGFILSLSQ